ncbi:hypothetical protein BZA77DRAFT_302548 [Pyronema omphalodes]|nr:hypothetical protein BZA77DRAFT_302548 [Pyronema omphalodes]
MSSYIVTFKPDCPDAEIQKAKDDIIAQGGSIDHEYTLIRGFSCSMPEGHVSTLDANPHVENLERDGQVTTQ